ncbi:MAG TPA: exonuclease SbcCD subunit D C-terminal domain-containing protein, partial [Myxococcota bacterium]|nr:exonuclease SbcCD subunit D C-terminal domain-containing protein [Myxococcota bacterium]
GPEAERVVYEVLRRMGRVCPVLVIAGNHDNPRRFEAWGVLAELANIRCVAKPRGLAAGGLLKIETPRGTARVAPIPFAPIRWFVTAEGLADESAAMSSYAQGVQRMAAQLAGGFTADAVNLLMAHTHVDGATLAKSERVVHLGDQWAIEPAAIPSSAQYAALGHIHKPQAVRHGVEYAGSPLQLDYGEEGEEKSFVFIEARPNLPVQTRRVAYEGGIALTTFTGSLDELTQRADTLRGAGHLRVVLQLAEPIPDVVKLVRERVPNAVTVQVRLPQMTTEKAPLRDASPVDLYRDFFQKRHGHAPDDAVLDAFSRLYEEVELGPGEQP